jgi:hypothetical protein
MLVLDAFKGHLTSEVKSAIHAMNTDLMVIPGGMTSQLQFLDAAENKPFQGPFGTTVVSMALGWGPYSDTYWENKEAQCSTAVPVDQDIMATDLSRTDSQRI